MELNSNIKVLFNLDLTTKFRAIIDICRPAVARQSLYKFFVQYCPMHTESKKSPTPRSETGMSMYNFSLPAHQDEKPAIRKYQPWSMSRMTRPKETPSIPISFLPNSVQ